MTFVIGNCAKKAQFPVVGDTVKIELEYDQTAAVHNTVPATGPGINGWKVSNIAVSLANGIAIIVAVPGDPTKVRGSLIMSALFRLAKQIGFNVAVLPEDFSVWSG